MSFDQQSAVQRAKKDLAHRLNISESEIQTKFVSEKDFSDMSLGTPVGDEMSASMISSGWQINLTAAGEDYEYRADKHQVRLRGFNGTNYIIES